MSFLATNTASLPARIFGVFAVICISKACYDGRYRAVVSSLLGTAIWLMVLTCLADHSGSDALTWYMTIVAIFDLLYTGNIIYWRALFCNLP